jgi:hypothetical protein
MRRLKTLWLLLPALVFSGVTAAQQCQFDDPTLMELPGATGEPTQVLVRLYVNDVIEVRDVEQSFVSDVVLRAEWEDPRLVHTESAGCVAGEQQIWSPRLQPVNLRNIDRLREPELQVSPEGQVVLVTRGVGEFSFEADLSDFPFDAQKLNFVLASTYGPEAVSLYSKASAVGFADHFSTANWLIEFSGVESSSLYFAATEKNLASLSINLVGTRLPGYYTWKLILPLILVVMMSWSVFWMAPIHVAPRTGLAATSMLTLIAYRFALASYLPPIAYLTRLDMFLVFASVLVFAALVIAVAVTYVADQGLENQALRINQLARWLSPGLFAGVLLWAFWL